MCQVYESAITCVTYRLQQYVSTCTVDEATVSGRFDFRLNQLLIKELKPFVSLTFFWILV